MPPGPVRRLFRLNPNRRWSALVMVRSVRLCGAGPCGALVRALLPIRAPLAAKQVPTTR